MKIPKEYWSYSLSTNLSYYSSNINSIPHRNAASNQWNLFISVSIYSLKFLTQRRRTRTSTSLWRERSQTLVSWDRVALCSTRSPSCCRGESTPSRRSRWGGFALAWHLFAFALHYGLWLSSKWKEFLSLKETKSFLFFNNSFLSSKFHFLLFYSNGMKVIRELIVRVPYCCSNVLH